MNRIIIDFADQHEVDQFIKVVTEAEEEGELDFPFNVQYINSDNDMICFLQEDGGEYDK